MNTSKLHHAVLVCRAMTSPSVAGGDLHGVVKLTPLVRESLDKLVEFGLAFDLQHLQHSDGEEMPVEFSVPRGESEFFAQSWSDLLGSHNFLYERPGAYFVLDDNFYSVEDKKTVMSRRYNGVHSLLSVLKEVADYTDKSTRGMKLIFLTGNKLEIPVKYSADELRDCPKVDDLKSDIEGASVKHQDQRKAIVKVILNELLSTSSADDRFKELLNNFYEFHRRYRDSYDLYVAEFSFEKVLEEVNSHKLDYTIKLNKVFSDIQGQLLAVPAALILIGSKMTEKGFLEWQNTLTMLGCIIFVGLMDMLIRNQYNSLRAIDTEIQQQQTKLVAEHAAVLEKFSKPYKDLEDRYRHQKLLIRIVDGLVAAMFLFCVVLYFWYSTDKFHWIKYLLQL